MLGQRRPDDRVIVYSANFKRRTSFELDALGLSQRQSWINYPQGVADALQRAGHHLPGMNLLLWGNVPLGAGMSSSAAVEIACMLVFERLAGIHLDPRDEALLAQRGRESLCRRADGHHGPIHLAARRGGPRLAASTVARWSTSRLPMALRWGGARRRA